MSNLTPRSYDGRLTYRDCIQHIQFSLADICIQETWSDVSLWRFLNRTSFLFQIPLCFAVFRRSAASYILDRDRNTMRDPLYRTDFEKALTKLGVPKSGVPVPITRLCRYSIKLFTTDFYVIAFEVRGGRHEPCCLQDISFIPLTSESTIGNTLSSVFSPFSFILSQMQTNDHLNKRFTEQFSSSTFLDAKQDNPVSNPITQPGLDIINYHYMDLTHQIIENEIERILKSPVIYQDGISNFLLCIKTFSRRAVRFGHYYYDINLYLSEIQREQIRNKLTCSAIDRMAPFCNKEASIWVRDCVASGQYGEIFDVLETPLSDHSRLFCEYTLLSGASIINIDPFSRGDIGWYEKEFAAARPNDFDHEMRRFAAFHYILLLMAGTINRPALLTIPIRVDGTTWMNITTIVGTDENADYAGIVDVNEFERRFMLYHSLLRDFETRIRRKTKQGYMRAVSQILSKQIEVAAKRQHIRSSDGQIMLRAEDFINLAKNLLSLCRLYPYKPVLFGPLGAAEKYGWDGGKIEGSYEIDCAIAGPNPYFDRAPLRDFLSSKEVRVRVREIINSEIGFQEIHMHGEDLIRKLSFIGVPGTRHGIFEELQRQVKNTPLAEFFKELRKSQFDIENHPNSNASRAISIRDDPEFWRVAAESKWRDRGKLGFPWRTNIAEFLLEIYGSWIGKGMNQSDLLVADKSAWYALQNFLRSNKLPFHFPKHKETYVEAITNPDDQQKLFRARKLNAERMRMVGKIA